MTKQFERVFKQKFYQSVLGILLVEMVLSLLGGLPEFNSNLTNALTVLASLPYAQAQQQAVPTAGSSSLAGACQANVVPNTESSPRFSTRQPSQPPSKIAFLEHSQAQKLSTTGQSLPTELFKLGHQGKQIQELQKALTLLGYYSGPVDGIFGPLTQASVQRFQKRMSPFNAQGQPPTDGANQNTWNQVQVAASAKILVRSLPKLTPGPQILTQEPVLTLASVALPQVSLGWIGMPGILLLGGAGIIIATAGGIIYGLRLGRSTIQDTVLATVQGTQPVHPRVTPMITGLDVAPPLWPELTLPSQRQLRRWMQQHGLSVLTVAGLIVVAQLPYELRPGGQIEILPVEQQRLQSQVQGQIKQVFYAGGDGQVIPADTVIATVETPELQNQYQQTQELINSQTAVVQAAQSDLNQLLNLPRPEEVEVSESRVATAQKQVKVAQQELERVKIRAQYSQSEAERYQSLFVQGAVSQQDVENFKRQADVEQAEVLTQQTNILEQEELLAQRQAELKVVLAGAAPDEIQAARDRMSAAQAEIRRLNQQLTYLADELKRTEIRMPFEGRLVENQLTDKVGTYLEQGNTFAIAESNQHQNLLGRIQIPEISASQLVPNQTVEIKLLAFPDTPLTAKVVAIEPKVTLQDKQQSRQEISGETFISSETAGGRMVGVIIELPNPDGKVLPGMTGYAKIEGTEMPLFKVFSRSLIRFIKVEAWSWLP